MDRVSTNNSTDNIQYLQLPIKVKQLAKLKDFLQFDSLNIDINNWIRNMEQKLIENIDYYIIK